MQKHFQTPSFLVLVVLPYYYRGIQSHSGASCTTGLDAGDSLIPRVVQSCANDLICLLLRHLSELSLLGLVGLHGTPILFAQSLAHLLNRCKDGGRWTWLEMSNALRYSHSDLKDCIFMYFRTNGAVAEQQKHEMAPQGFLTSVLYLQALQQVAFIPTAGPSAEQASHSFNLSLSLSSW